MTSLELSKEDVPDLIKALTALHWTHWKDAENFTASRALDKVCKPLAELIEFVVAGVLVEMRSNPMDPQVQSAGIGLLKAFIHDNKAAKVIVLRSGGVEAIVQSVQHHPNDEALLSTALEVIDEIHGLPALLQALDNLKASTPGVRAALWALSKAAEKRWSDVEKLPPQQLVQTLLSVANAHHEDYRILSSALEFISDLTLETPELRCTFANSGGWEWLLRVMETHDSDGKLQILGFKVLSSLGRGGAFEELHTARTMAILERALCQHDSNQCVLYWALWAAQQLNGARALVAPLRGGVFKTANAALAALRSLGGVQFGQSAGAGVADMPAVIDAVVFIMSSFSERFDVLYECTIVLGHATAFVVSEACHTNQQPLVNAAEIAINALLKLVDMRLSDASTVQAACEAFAEIMDSCPEESPLRASIAQSLVGRDEKNGGEHLLARAAAAHVSNDRLQSTLMWVIGVVHGAPTIVRQMAQHNASQAMQMSAIRTLGMLYGDRIELNSEDMECLPDAIRAVLFAMAKFPETIVLQQHACYALYTMADHATNMHEEAYVQCATAAAQALQLVKGRGDGGRSPGSYNALYLRKEATRCIVAICGAQPSLGRWLREQGLQEPLADALKTTAESVWDGRRDSETEETLCLELLALSYVLGPHTTILESLRRWGTMKPAVARAAADAVVELARHAIRRGPSTTASTDLTSAAIVAPVQALNAAGCSMELQAAMQAHASDDDLQGRLNLAVGFIAGQ